MRSTSSRKLGSRRLRGCGRVTLISLKMRPGLLPNTSTRSHINTASSMLCVTRITPLMGMRPSAHRSKKSVRSVSAVSTSSAENGSSMSRIFGCTTSARAKPTRWRMPPGQFARIGGLESVQADEVDGRQRALADFRPRHALRLQPQRHVFKHGEPRKQRKALEHHGNAGRRTRNRFAEVLQIPGAGLGESRDQPQQRRLSRAGSAQAGRRFVPRAAPDSFPATPTAPRRPVSETPCEHQCIAAAEKWYSCRTLQVSRYLRSA